MDNASDVTDLIAEVRKKREERQGFANQFVEGAKQSASLGYAGETAPDNLPLTGKIGRVAGDMVGITPAFVAGGAALGAVGVTGLAAELATGAIYGAVRKPEESETRIHNAVKDAAVFGAGYGVLKGIGAGARALFGGAEDTGAKAAANRIGGANKASEAGKPSEEYGGDPIFAAQKSSPPDYETPVGIGINTPEDLAAYKAKQEDYGYLRDRAVNAPDSFEPPPTGSSPEQQLEQFGSQFSKIPFETPDEMVKTMETQDWDKLVGSWAKDFIQNVPKEQEYFASALATGEHDLEAATMQMIKDSGKFNLNENPLASTTEIMSTIPKMETQHALQGTIDEIVTKNALPVETIQAASQVKEPINFLMSKGVNFDDAAQLVDTITERAKLTGEEIIPAQTVKFTGKNAPKPVPEWEKASKRSYMPDEVFDLFYNVPFKGADAMKHGLIERRGLDQEFHLTEKGYAFLKQYNPEGLTEEYPEFISKKSLGSIRGQGYSNLSHTAPELKELGFKMGADTALERGFIRPAVKNGKEIPGEFQLTEKGAGMLAGGKGANANINLKAYDQAAGRRLLPGETEGIEKMAADRARNKILFKDIFEEVNNAGKGCPE